MSVEIGATGQKACCDRSGLMCIIIYKPAGATVPQERLEAAAVGNSDGFGAMWADQYPDMSRMVSNKNGGFTRMPNYCPSKTNMMEYEYFNDTGKRAVVHFRTASSGRVGPQYEHPIPVTDGLHFMANGNLFEFSDAYGWDDDRTDVQRFSDEVLKKLPDGFLGECRIREALEEYCLVNHTKMVFMDQTGAVTIINEAAGEWVDGVWYSNGGLPGYTGYGFSGAYEYQDGDVRHPGGFITPMVFGENRHKYTRCPGCKGWFGPGRLSGWLCTGCGALQRLRDAGGI